MPFKKAKQTRSILMEDNKCMVDRKTAQGLTHQAINYKLSISRIISTSMYIEDQKYFDYFPKP